MSNTARVDKNLFEESHYLGRPADADDLIIQRRIRILKSHAEFMDNKASLLEIGCGNGITMLQLAPDFASATGLEYVDSHRQTFNMLKDELKVSNAVFLQWDIMASPYVPQADRLISFEVIEHLPSEDGVANYAGSVKKGALCAFTVPNKWWIFETHGARLPLLPWNRVPFFSWLPKPIHEKYALARIYTRKRICRLLEKHGFEVLNTSYVTAPMDVVKWPPLKNFLRRYFFGKDTTRNPFKAVSIFVLVRKL